MNGGIFSRNHERSSKLSWIVALADNGSFLLPPTGVPTDLMHSRRGCHSVAIIHDCLSASRDKVDIIENNNAAL
jgi:hypothetical protein